jgi:hypothetical protein
MPKAPYIFPSMGKLYGVPRPLRKGVRWSRDRLADIILLNPGKTATYWAKQLRITHEHSKYLIYYSNQKLWKSKEH